MIRTTPEPTTIPGTGPAGPPIDPQAFLQAFLDSKLTLAGLAEKLSLSPLKLAQAAAHPDIQPHLRALEDLAAIRLRIAAADARLVAIQALRKNLDEPTLDPTERRRAAALLLRNLTKPLDAPASDLALAAGSAPPPVSRPSRALGPHMIAYDVVDALRNNNRPEPDTGLATLHAFLDPEASIGEDEHEVGLRSLDEFIEDPPDLLDAFLSAGRVEHTPTEYSRTSGRVYHKVTLHARRSIPGAAPLQPDPAPGAYYLEFRQPDLGPREGCWLIRSILTEAQRLALDPPAPPRVKNKPTTNGTAPDSS